MQGVALEGQDMEFLNLAAAGELAFALQTVIFYTINTPTLLQFWDHSPYLSVIHNPTQTNVYTKNYTGESTE